MKKIISVALAVILVVFLFASCASKSDESELVGKWELAEGSATMSLKFVRDIEFFSDGTVQGDDTGGRYSIEDGKLKIYYAAMDSYVYYYELDGDVLILKENETDEKVHKYVREGASLNEIEEETEDAFGENRLSASCDYVLASGTSDNGDFYELVANDSKTLEDKPQIGVIKNNEWLVEMTSENCPFINNSGNILNFGDVKDGIAQYSFVKNNWFATRRNYSREFDVIWNPETNVSYQGNNYGDIKFIETENGDNIEYGLDDNFMMTVVRGDAFSTDTCYIVDLSTMKTVNELNFEDESAFSEGLFFGRNYLENNRNAYISGFYDETGKLVIDLSKYNISSPENVVFQNGICTFVAYGTTGNKFEITIDKTGKVLSENPVN